MAAMIELDVRDARRIALASQGLARPAAFGRGLPAVRRAIDRLGYVQIDTISVVERAHHHVLRSRVPNYAQSMLDRLLADREVFEYWFHAAACLPMADYRYYLPMMAGFGNTRPLDPKITREIIARIEAEGPVQSRDFEAPAGHKSGGWWDWKPAKQALENMFLSGRLMVSRREGFKKIFDLPDNVIPDHVDRSFPEPQEWAHHFARTMLEAKGIGTTADLTYPVATIQRFMKRRLRQEFITALEELVEEGDAVAVRVGGERYLTTAGYLDTIPGRISRQQVKLLSPFDNLVINRRRLQALFDFDYQIECYVPEAKRRFGYFCLPMLYGDRLVGRLDAKADRESRTLIAQGLFLEEGFNLDDGFIETLRTSLDAFAADNDCDEVRIVKSTPARLARAL